MTISEQWDLVFSQEYLKPTLLISLLTVWVLVALFNYLNRFTKRDYFAIWTASWLFYGLWLTLGLAFGNPPLWSLLFTLKQTCVTLSAVFLLWGSLRFLGLRIPKVIFGSFLAFLAAWTIVSPQVVKGLLEIQMPVFILLGLSSIFAGFCFFRLRKRKAFAGAGMLALGFVLWGFYLAAYPIAQQYENLYCAGFFFSAVLQLFIAVSMIVLVLEEVRENMVRKERLQAVGEMAVSVAHDVNNALCPITGYADLLLTTQPNLNDDARENLERILASADNVAQIVTRMRQCYNREIDTKLLKRTRASLPAERPAEIKPASRPAVVREPHRSLNVLYIDDEPQLRQLMRDVLDLQGHTVTLARGGVEGLEIFRAGLRGSAPFDVVLTDLGMPEMDGRHVARSVKAESPATPVVLLTGWGAMMNAEGEIVPEVDALVGKPPNMAELNNVILRLADRRKAPSQVCAAAA